jgi:hypothetical protein
MRWPWRNPQAPVPGQHPTRPHTPRGQSPAPAPRHGGVAFALNARECAVTAWKCGRWLVYDAHGQVVFARECRCRAGPNWQRWERELAQ